MDSHELTQLLEGVRAGRVAPADAVLKLRTVPFEETGGFAKVDLHRRPPLRVPRGDLRPGEDGRADRGHPADAAPPRAGGTGHPGRAGDGRAPAAASSPTGEYNALGRTFRVRGPRRPRAEAGQGGGRDGRDERPARGRGGAGDGRGVELRRSRSWPTSAWPACTGCSHQLHALGGADAIVVVAGHGGGLAERRRRAGRLPGDRRADQHRLRGAASAGWPRCWGCSTAAPRTWWS